MSKSNLKMIGITMIVVAALLLSSSYALLAAAGFVQTYPGMGTNEVKLYSLMFGNIVICSDGYPVTKFDNGYCYALLAMFCCSLFGTIMAWISIFTKKKIFAGISILGMLGVFMSIFFIKEGGPELYKFIESYNDYIRFPFMRYFDTNKGWNLYGPGLLGFYGLNLGAFLLLYAGWIVTIFADKKYKKVEE